MGVSELWSLLKAEGVTTSWSGRTGGHAAVVQEVENTAIAIDLSTWILQATSQPNLVEVFQDPECRALIVTFNRAVNFLRYGCVPVGVVEGRAPAEKLERLQQRFKARMGYHGGGNGNKQFARLGKNIAALLSALGVPVVQAPGEGEAMCAALNQQGLVDGCATLDGDVLLFGARTVYHTFKLQSQDPQNSEVLKVNLVGEQSVQSMLGIQTGGADALTALSLLCGGDYAIKGAENVGSKQAVRMLQHLLEGHQDDSKVLEDLADLVESPRDPNMELLSAQGCTGCKQCKHPGNRKNTIKKHSKANPCPCCPSAFVQEHQTCQGRPNQPCECPFHKLEALRHVDKAVRRIQATPGFVDTAQQAAAAYHQQRQAASHASALVRSRYSVAEGQSLLWLKRPNVQQVAEQLSWLEEVQIRSKLLPLLMQWDLCHPNQEGREFEPESITKVHVQKAENEEDCWRYMVKWRRLPEGSPEEIEADKEWLKKSGSEARAVKKSFMQEHYPGLVAQFLQKQKSGATKQTQANKQKADAKATKKMAGVMTSFLQQKKKLGATEQQQPHASLLPKQASRGLADAAVPAGAASRGPGAVATGDSAAASSMERDTSLRSQSCDNRLHNQASHSRGLATAAECSAASAPHASKWAQSDGEHGHLPKPGQSHISVAAAPAASAAPAAPAPAASSAPATASAAAASAAAAAAAATSASDDLGLEELLAFNSSQQVSLTSPAGSSQQRQVVRWDSPQASDDCNLARVPAGTAAASSWAVAGRRRVLRYDDLEGSLEANEQLPVLVTPTASPSAAATAASCGQSPTADGQLTQHVLDLHKQPVQDDVVIEGGDKTPRVAAASECLLLTPRQKRAAEEEEQVDLVSPDRTPTSSVALDLTAPSPAKSCGVVQCKLHPANPSPAKRQRTPPASPLYLNSPHHPTAPLKSITTPAAIRQLCPAGQTAEDAAQSSSHRKQQHEGHQLASQVISSETNAALSGSHPPQRRQEHRLGRQVMSDEAKAAQPGSRPQQQCEEHQLGRQVSSEADAAQSGNHPKQQHQGRQLGSQVSSEANTAELTQMQGSEATQGGQKQASRQGSRGKGRGGQSARTQAFMQAAAGAATLDSARFGFVRLPAGRLMATAQTVRTAGSDPDISSDDDTTHGNTPRLRAGNTVATTPQSDCTEVWHNFEVDLLTPSDYIPRVRDRYDGEVCQQHDSNSPGDVRALRTCDIHKRPSACAEVQPSRYVIEESSGIQCTPAQHDAAHRQKLLEPTLVNLVTPSTVASTIATPSFSDCDDVVDLTQT